MRSLVTLATLVAFAVTPSVSAWAQTTPDVASAPAAEQAAPTPDPAATPVAEAAPPAPTGPVVTYTVRAGQPTFVMSTAASASFAMIGAFAMIAEGKRIAAMLQLEEPANVVGAEIAAAYAVSKGGQVTTDPIAVTAPKQDLLASNAGKDTRAAYIVDVAPVGLNAIYFSFDWTHYGLIYSSNLRVLNGADGKQIAKAKCFIGPKKTPDSPTYDQLLENNGQVLKKMIAAGNAECVEQMKKGLGL